MEDDALKPPQSEPQGSVAQTRMDWATETPPVHANAMSVTEADGLFAVVLGESLGLEDRLRRSA